MGKGIYRIIKTVNILILSLGVIIAILLTMPALKLIWPKDETVLAARTSAMVAFQQQELPHAEVFQTNDKGGSKAIVQEKSNKISRNSSPMVEKSGAPAYVCFEVVDVGHEKNAKKYIAENFSADGEKFILREDGEFYLLHKYGNEEEFFALTGKNKHFSQKSVLLP